MAVLLKMEGVQASQVTVVGRELVADLLPPRGSGTMLATNLAIWKIPSDTNWGVKPLKERPKFSAAIRMEQPCLYEQLETL